MSVTRHTVIVDFISNVKGFMQGATAPQEFIRKLHTPMGKLNKDLIKNASAGQKLGLKFRSLMVGARGFRMELLGVMFFGMGVAKMFMGLLQPAMQAFGIFELWGTMLTLVFLPIISQLFPYFLKLIEFFMNLPPSVQLAIGVFVIIAAVLGQVLFFAGMLGLGIGSLIQFWGLLAPVVTFISGLFSAGLIPILAVVAAVVIGLWLAWKENFGKIREWAQVMWDGLKSIFNGIWNLIKGLVTIIVGLFSGDLTKVVEGFKMMWEGVKQIIGGVFKFLLGLLVTLGLAIWRVLVGIGTVIKDAFIAIINWIIDKINWLIAQVNKLAGKLGITISPIPKISTGESKRYIGSFQFGGVVQKEGMYHLHAGETVTPSTGGEMVFSPTVNITGGVGDITAIRDALTDDWMSMLERRMARR